MTREPEEELDAKTLLLRSLRNRTFKHDRNTMMLYSGELRDGKTTMAAKTIIGFGDTTYVPSLLNHPAYTGDPSREWKCHLSVNPAPFIEAVNHELERVEAGLPQEYLVPGSWWHFDEPTDLKSTDWYTQLAKDVGDTLTENAFLRINIALCTPTKGKTLGMFRDLSNFWVRVYKRGHGMLHIFESRINYKSAARPEIRRPRGVLPIVDETDPQRDPKLVEWYKLYFPIKVYNAKLHSAQRIERYRKGAYVN
jgi:hypothetical protein